MCVCVCVCVCVRGYLCTHLSKWMMSYWLNGLGTNQADSYAKLMCNMCNTYSETGVNFCAV